MDKVKAGKWGNVMSAVANLGAAATSVGVSVGVAAAEPLAKDIARSFEELTGSVEVSVFAGGEEAGGGGLFARLTVYSQKGMGSPVDGGGRNCVLSAGFCPSARPVEPAILATGSIDGPTFTPTGKVMHIRSHTSSVSSDSGLAVYWYCLRALSFQPTDPIARARQAANRAKVDAERKVWGPFVLGVAITVCEFVQRFCPHNPRFSHAEHIWLSLIVELRCVCCNFFLMQGALFVPV